MDTWGIILWLSLLTEPQPSLEGFTVVRSLILYYNKIDWNTKMFAM